MTKEMYENMVAELGKARDYYRKVALSYLDEISTSDIANATETDIAIRYLLNAYLDNENSDEEDGNYIKEAAYMLLNAYNKQSPKGTNKVGNLCLIAFDSLRSNEEDYEDILRYLYTYIYYNPLEGDENA